jgi:ferredoxin
MVTQIGIVDGACIGAGQCVLAAPEYFDQREDDGIVIVLKEHPEESDLPAVTNAARRCPVRAIRLEDE